MRSRDVPEMCRAAEPLGNAGVHAPGNVAPFPVSLLLSRLSLSLSFSLSLFVSLSLSLSISPCLSNWFGNLGRRSARGVYVCVFLSEVSTLTAELVGDAGVHAPGNVAPFPVSLLRARLQRPHLRRGLNLSLFFISHSSLELSDTTIYEP